MGKTNNDKRIERITLKIKVPLITLAFLFITFSTLNAQSLGILAVDRYGNLVRYVSGSGRKPVMKNVISGQGVIIYPVLPPGGGRIFFFADDARRMSGAFSGGKVPPVYRYMVWSASNRKARKITTGSPFSGSRYHSGVDPMKVVRKRKVIAPVWTGSNSLLVNNGKDILLVDLEKGSAELLWSVPDLFDFDYASGTGTVFITTGKQILYGTLTNSEPEGLELGKKPHKGNFDPYIDSIAVSPDGSMLVYNVGNELVTRDMVSNRESVHYIRDAVIRIRWAGEGRAVIVTGSFTMSGRSSGSLGRTSIMLCTMKPYKIYPLADSMAEPLDVQFTVDPDRQSVAWSDIESVYTASTRVEDLATHKARKVSIRRLRVPRPVYFVLPDLIE